MNRILLFAILALPLPLWAADSPFEGTWKVDLDSIELPDKPMTVALQDGMYESSSSVPNIKVRADGSDQAVAGAPGYDTLAVRVVNDSTVEFTAKREGKVVSRSRLTVSADGKTATENFTEYPPASSQPITGSLTLTRLSAGRPGSHAISGSWRTQKVSASENALTATFRSIPDGMAMSTSAGESYEAKFDGKDYPMKGSLPGMTVSLNRVNDRSIISTIKRDGKVVNVNHATVSADGKTCTVRIENREQGTTIAYTARKL
ncbi:MAG: hypothetical protein JXP48_09885 [Acidobacteria bacterium]|nr:hypothetical protein [Acidobacteriota bacterium]